MGIVKLIYKYFEISEIFTAYIALFVCFILYYIDEVPVPVSDSQNEFIAKYMKQRQQLLKDAQDNKKQVQGIKIFCCKYCSVKN